jgi:hypothetical protein
MDETSVFHQFGWQNYLFLLLLQANNLTTDNFVVDKMMPELLELVNTYLPDILWSDGEAGGQLLPARHPPIGGEVVGFLK